MHMGQCQCGAATVDLFFLLLQDRAHFKMAMSVKIKSSTDVCMCMD